MKHRIALFVFSTIALTACQRQEVTEAAPEPTPAVQSSTSVTVGAPVAAPNGSVSVSYEETKAAAEVQATTDGAVAGSVTVSGAPGAAGTVVANGDASVQVGADGSVTLSNGGRQVTVPQGAQVTVPGGGNVTVNGGGASVSVGHGNH